MHIRRVQGFLDSFAPLCTDQDIAAAPDVSGTKRVRLPMGRSALRLRELVGHSQDSGNL
jgi:hypothetical protein